ncbi:hypothetical protein CN603_13035 [Bacillus toyonensis]|uniref:hypothetical protein n=1 Tax=Bacillus toyonensis TaxID=155322 RepID=UPI000BF1776B|nr:hypothetical protein [Bacillus toyonensis]PEL75406.1 hypothetical protein CN603_13035 [Bacillus toyonensis]
MAGSEESNEELVSGRVNHAEDTTSFWAQCHENGDDFNGNEVVNVSIQEHVDHEDLEEEGINTMPTNPINGIYSEGFRSGTGIIAKGGYDSGTGVIGQGGGIKNTGERGSGGIGVNGIGGSVSFDSGSTFAGAGLVGQGGIDENINDSKHGAGVIGIAGGAGKQLPLNTDTGSVGVYGQGAEAIIQTKNIEGETKNIGPQKPGPGVLGRGGIAVNERMPVAAGVIGLAGNRDIPNHSVTGDKGVYGEGPTGVQGTGTAGPGIYGSSDENRGGVFRSGRNAQVQLIPYRENVVFPDFNTVTSNGIVSPTEIGIQGMLPKDGFGGDLMSISDGKGVCTLWFCVRGPDQNSPALWRQVLLGESIRGEK